MYLFQYNYYCCRVASHRWHSSAYFCPIKLHNWGLLLVLPLNYVIIVIMSIKNSLSLSMKTVEAERISVDHVAHLKPSDGGSAATQCIILLYFDLLKSDDYVLFHFVLEFLEKTLCCLSHTWFMTIVAAHLTGIHSAIKMLNCRIRILHQYLLAMQKGDCIWYCFCVCW